MADPLYGVDVGRAYADAENIKGAKTQNKLSALKLKQAERQEKQAPEMQKRQNALTGLRQKAATGDADSQRQLLALDPEGGAKFIDAVSKMDKSQLDRTKNTVDEIGRMSATVLNAKPERQATLYQQMLSMLPDDARSKMPNEFDPDFMQLSLSKATAMDKILENPKVIQFGGQDVIYKQGRELNRAATPEKSKTPLVTVQTGGDKKEVEKLAELRVGKLDQMQERAMTAEDQIESINQIKAIDLDTGLGVETRGQIAKVWDSLGGDGKALTGVDPSDVQKFKAVATKQVLDIMASQKGPQTDSDAKRIEKAVAALGNSKNANEFIMNAAVSIANRKIEQAAFYEKFLENEGTLRGADSAWREFKIKTPMVSEVVKNPETGSPVFFYQFRDKMREKNYADDDIVIAWRRMNSGG